MSKKWVVVVMLLLTFSCRRNNSDDCSEASCPAIYFAGPFLKFTISDKLNNQDLFFGTPPQYQLKDLVVFKNKNITDTIHIPFYIDSSTTLKYFAVIASGSPDSLFIQIRNQKPDTFYVTSKPVFSNCCPSGYIFTSIKLNGKLICGNCDVSTIVAIKK